MDFDISEAVYDDAQAIALLLNEVDSYYGDTVVEGLSARTSAVKEALFSERPAARVLLLRVKGNPVAFAALSTQWPAAGSTSSIFIKELFVRESFRSQGLGEALFRHACKTAVELGASRVELTTDRDNDGAQRFYGRLGVPVSNGKILYRIPAEALGNFS